MTAKLKVLMTGTASPERVAFYRAMTPPEFEPVWIDDPANPKDVAVVLQDVECSFGSLLLPGVA